jgi:hypothetical protein
MERSFNGLNNELFNVNDDTRAKDRLDGMDDLKPDVKKAVMYDR